MNTMDIKVNSGKVDCPAGKIETLERCRFCIHGAGFVIAGKTIHSPARAFCNVTRATEDVDLLKVEYVICDDISAKGFGSIMNIIS